jgi:hypothetical protein
MNSLLKIAASRANGAKSRGPVTAAGRLAALANSAKSTGPVTQAGRERSAQNAIRHGILAESVVLDGESVECFIEVLSTLQDELQPLSAIESRYVETMALAEWRRLRLICLEKEQIAIETQRQEAADLGNLNNPNNLNDPDNANKNTDPAAVTPVANEVSSIRYTARAFRAMSDESRAQELLNRYESRYDRQYERAMNGLRAYRAEKRKDEREARRRERDRLRKSAKGERSVLRDQGTSASRAHTIPPANPLNPKLEIPDLRENAINENAEQSEPEIG